MAKPKVPFSSPYYPFEKAVEGINTLKGAELIPYKIINYLLDLPDAYGYEPPDDNDYPRCRLAKYLWYDGAKPLSNPLPTPEEKRSLLFNPDDPVLNEDEQKKRHPKGYRIFPQRVVNQSILDAKTLLKVYPGRILDPSDYRTVITYNIEIWCNTGFITNTRTTAYDRTFDIEQCIREAIVGVDIAGVGCFHASRQEGSYNGSENYYTDSELAGRILYLSTSWSDSGGGTINANNIY